MYNRINTEMQTGSRLPKTLMAMNPENILDIQLIPAMEGIEL